MGTQSVFLVKQLIRTLFFLKSSDPLLWLKVVRKDEKEVLDLKRYQILEDKVSSLSQKTRSHSAQFSTNVPMLDLTHGAVVAGERMFVFGGERQPYYEWEECGLVVHVPEYGIPPLSTCEMRVSALAGGDFIFPDGHELVSAVYAVTFSHFLQQDVVLELQHCVDLQIEEDTDCLSFAVASPLASPGSYTFSLVKRGRFGVRDRYGSIEASMSLCYCILMSEYALNEKSGDSNKTPSDGTKHEQEECNNDYQSGKEDSDSSCGSGGEAEAAGSDGGSEDSSSIDHSSDEKPESEEDDDNTSEEEVESNESSEDRWDAKQKNQQLSENQAPVKPETSSEENIELESCPTFKDELKAELMDDQLSNTKVHLDPSVKSENLFSNEKEKMEASLENDHKRQKRQHEKPVHHDILLVKSKNISERYSSSTDKHQNTNKLYYVCQTLIVKNPARCWVAKAVFAKDLKVLTNYIKRNSSSDMMQEGIVIFHFKKDYFILNVLPMTKHDGWNVVPLVQHPYKIYQKSIDSFGASKFQEPVLSMYKAFAESDAERVLVYPLMITDVEETGLTLNIVIDGYDHVSPRMDTATASTERHELTDSTATTTSILDKKPSLKDACNMLRDHSSQWDDIGLQLDIPFDKRTEWHRDGSLTNEQRLQRMLIHWFEGGCHTPVTWGGLIEILKESYYMATAEKIETFLKTEKAQKAYK